MTDNKTPALAEALVLDESQFLVELLGPESSFGRLYQAAQSLAAQVVERDAVIRRAPHGANCWVKIPTERCNCWKSQAPRDALAARDAVRDKTVRATALNNAADVVERMESFDQELVDPAGFLRSRAAREESNA